MSTNTNDVEETTQQFKPAVNPGVGMPAWIYLNQFGKVVHDAFGSWPYLVGSAVVGKTWRDVDVRLILADDVYISLIGPRKLPDSMHPRWCAFNLAFSELGRKMTGLPIDFQIQQQSKANAEYPMEPRCALIMAGNIIEAEFAQEAKPE